MWETSRKAYACVRLCVLVSSGGPRTLFYLYEFGTTYASYLSSERQRDAAKCIIRGCYRPLAQSNGLAEGDIEFEFTVLGLQSAAICLRTRGLHP